MTKITYILLITILILNITTLTTQQKKRETYKDYIKSLPAYGQTNLQNQCSIL